MAHTWPNGARCVVAFTVDFDGTGNERGHNYDPVGIRSAGGYSARRGVPRMLDIFERRGIPICPDWFFEVHERLGRRATSVSLKRNEVGIPFLARAEWGAAGMPPELDARIGKVIRELLIPRLLADQRAEPIGPHRPVGQILPIGKAIVAGRGRDRCSGRGCPGRDPVQGVGTTDGGGDEIERTGRAAQGWATDGDRGGLVGFLARRTPRDDADHNAPRRTV